MLHYILWAKKKCYINVKIEGVADYNGGFMRQDRHTQDTPRLKLHFKNKITHKVASHAILNIVKLLYYRD